MHRKGGGNEGVEGLNDDSKWEQESAECRLTPTQLSISVEEGTASWTTSSVITVL